MSGVMLVSGEASGDNLGALLAKELRQHHPNLSIFGVGGDKMQSAGVEIIAPSSPLAVMGYWDVLRKLPAIFSLSKTIRREIRRRRPQLYIGIDAPDFNLPTAQYARAMGTKTVQYVSPSIWMWRKQRIHKICLAVDAVWCLLPFEKKMYDAVGLSAVYVGHPESQHPPIDKSQAREMLDIYADQKVVALMPGSRAGELRAHLPLFARVLQKLKTESLVFIAAAADENATRQIKKALPNVIVKRGMAREVLASADVALVKSGTIALQAALLGVPYLAVYRTSPIAMWLAMWRKFYLPFATLPNILCGRFVAPELLLKDARTDLITTQLLRLLNDPKRQEKQLSAFADLRAQLTSSQSAGDAAMRML